MSSRSLNEVLIKSPAELFDLVFAAYNLSFISPRFVCLHLYAKGRCTRFQHFIYRSIFAVQALRKRRVHVRCTRFQHFIYRSIFAVQALRKRRVHVHCAAYHFRMRDLKPFKSEQTT